MRTPPSSEKKDSIGHILGLITAGTPTSSETLTG